MVVLDGQDRGALLDALGDRRLRSILRVTADQAMTAAELSERLDIPLSTVYRKLDTLVETPLLERDYRLAADGKHPAQYRCPVQWVCVAIGDDVEDPPEDPAGADRGRRVVAVLDEPQQ